jgi:hypothetical protein
MNDQELKIIQSLTELLEKRERPGIAKKKLGIYHRKSIGQLSPECIYQIKILTEHYRQLRHTTL